MNNGTEKSTNNTPEPNHIGTSTNNVKTERQDEAEIRELAAKFVEANKAKMGIPQRNTQGVATGMNLLSFLNSDKSKKVSTPSSNNEEAKNVDEESLRGRFGWTSMGKAHIPYIIRSGENYCSVRMVEMKVLNKWLNYLHQDLYSCTNIRSYYITEVEARLLNEINLKHCDYQFGREQFTSRDLIVRLSDANEFYTFLGHCYHKLVNSLEADMPNRCGFIRINRESVVPYTIYNGQKYVPLFYFEGETDNLKQRADKLEGWDLSYLKFCCKVQGIRNELFAHDSCSVISLNDIKNYFPPGTVFEDYWPKKNLDSSQLLITGRTGLAQNVNWTRQPVGPPITSHPPPSPKPATQAKAAQNGPLHNVHVFGNYIAGQPPYHATQPRTASSAARPGYANAQTRHMRPTTAANYYGSLGQAPPPPLVRSNAMTAAYNAQNKTGNYMVPEAGLSSNNYHQATTQAGGYPPPPLLQHMNGGVSRYDVAQRYANSDLLDLDSFRTDNMAAFPNIVNQNPAHQASSRSATSTPNEAGSPLTNGRTIMNNSNMNTMNRSKSQTQRVCIRKWWLASMCPPDLYKMVIGMHTTLKVLQIKNFNLGLKLRYQLIPDEAWKLIARLIEDSPPAMTGNIPYRFQKVQVECETLTCINSKAGDYNNLLVTLSDLIKHFFNGVPLQKCQQVMQVLEIEVYKANVGQLQMLMETGKCQSLNDTVPLVQVRNVIDYMPQLKYMLSGMVSSEVAAKRQRTS